MLNLELHGARTDLRGGQAVGAVQIVQRVGLLSLGGGEHRRGFVVNRNA